jgi:hypothetical protein
MRHSCSYDHQQHPRPIKDLQTQGVTKLEVLLLLPNPLWRNVSQIRGKVTENRDFASAQLHFLPKTPSSPTNPVNFVAANWRSPV